jgi:hypothetical protein
MPSQSGLDFVGAGITGTNDIANGRTLITITSSGGGSSYYYNVKTYGATGDGSTDDTASINSAITAMTTGGTLFFPKGTYKTSGNHTISQPTTILGEGKAGFDGVTGAVSLINCTSGTNSLFTVTTYKASFEKIALQNTLAGTPSNGAGITVAGSTLVQRVDFESISVSKFYINIDVQVGCNWSMHDCHLYAPVLYALKVRNTQNADAGDWSIDSCSFYSAVYNATAAIRLESSGGGKITNTKINAGQDSHYFTRGIDASVSGSTIIFLFTNNSIENITGDAVYFTMTGGAIYQDISFTNNEFGLYSNNSGYCINIVSPNVGDI